MNDEWRTEQVKHKIKMRNAEAPRILFLIHRSEFIVWKLGRVGIEPTTLGLPTTPAFTGIHCWICSLDCIINLMVITNLAVVRRAVSEDPF